MNTDTKFSIKEAFKSVFKIYGQNFFVVFFLSVFSFILIGCASRIITLFYSSSFDYATTENYSSYISIIKALGAQCVKFFLQNMISFLLVSAFLPAFEGSKIKFRNYFPNFKKVFKALLVTIILTVVLLGISISEVFIFGSNSFPNFLVKNVNVSVFALTVLLNSLRYMLVFFYIEIVSGKSILQSHRNVLKLDLDNIKIFVFCMSLAFINCIVSVMFKLLIIQLGMSAIDTLFANIALIVLRLPLSILALISVYTQIVSSKANTQKMSLEIEDNIRLK